MLHTALAPGQALILAHSAQRKVRTASNVPGAEAD